MSAKGANPSADEFKVNSRGQRPRKNTAHLDCRNPGGVQAKPRRNAFGPFRAGNCAGNANLFRGFHPRLLRLFPFGERVTGGADIAR